MDMHIDKIYWIYASQYQDMSEEFIRNHTQYVDWSCVSNNKFTHNFIDEFKGRLNWSLLNNSTDKAFNDISFITTHTDYVDWDNVATYENLDLYNADILAFVNQNMQPQQTSSFVPINWDKMCEYQVIPEDILRANAEFNNWSIVCEHQTLSEGFIDEFKDVVDWEAVSRYQNVSIDFIESHMEYLYKYMINFFNRHNYYSYVKKNYQFPVRVGDIDITIVPVDGDFTEEKPTSFTTTITADDDATGTFIYKVGPYVIDVVYGETIDVNDKTWTNIVSGDIVDIPNGFVLTVALVSDETGIIIASDNISNLG